MNEYGDFDNKINPLINIKVVGIGGAGCHAINRMIVDEKFKGPTFISLNTDKQDLYANKAHETIVLGETITRGLGAGSNPEIGKQAAEESKEQIEAMLEGTDLLFITAGMGGGTGTGASPVVAQIAREKNILTIAVVTKPFSFEGKVRQRNADAGIETLKKFVDTLIVIPNEKLRQVMDNNASMLQCFRCADDVLRQGIQGISDLLLVPGLINLDFADLKTVIKNKGYAHMGICKEQGEGKMEKAIRGAVYSPLLETQIEGATGVILNFKGDKDLSLNEILQGAAMVREIVDDDCNIIFGAVIDPTMKNEIEVTIIATGFVGKDQNQTSSMQYNSSNLIGGGYQQKPTNFGFGNNFSKSAERPQERPFERQERPEQRYFEEKPETDNYRQNNRPSVEEFSRRFNADTERNQERKMNQFPDNGYIDLDEDDDDSDSLSYLLRKKNIK